MVRTPKIPDRILFSFINQVMRQADHPEGMPLRAQLRSIPTKERAIVRAAEGLLLGNEKRVDLIPPQSKEHDVIVAAKISPEDQKRMESYVLELMRQSGAPLQEVTSGAIFPQRPTSGISQPLLRAGRPLDEIVLDYLGFQQRKRQGLSLLDLVGEHVFSGQRSGLSDFAVFASGLAEVMGTQGAYNLQTLGKNVLDPGKVLSSPHARQALAEFFGAGNQILRGLNAGLALDYPSLVAFFRSFMKAELHQHTSGSVPAETIVELGRKKEYLDWSKLNAKFGVDIGRIIQDGDVEGLRRLIEYRKAGGDLASYLQAMEIAQQVMDDEAAIERVAYDIAKRNYADGVRFLEVRFSPRKNNLSPSAVVYSVLRGLKAAQVEHPDLEAKMILILMKYCSREYGLNLVRDIQQWQKNQELRDAIVGIDTAGEEIGYDPLKHKDAFDIAKKTGLVAESHAGESFKSLEDGLESIRSAIQILGVRRIGHALALGLNPYEYLGKMDGYGRPYTAERVSQIIALQEKVANEMIRRDIAITACPTSNRDTGNILSLDIHPILRFLELGLPVTINTDNPVTSATSLTEEFVKIGLARTLSLNEIIQLIDNGIKYRLSNLR